MGVAVLLFISNLRNQAVCANKESAIAVISLDQGAGTWPAAHAVPRRINAAVPAVRRAAAS
jgi:hypothetical protein